MSEEAQTMDADAPLVNPQNAEAPQEAEAPMPIHEPDPQAETQQAEDNEPLDRPDYYPEKFWDEDGPDVEKLAKSYSELEKAFKSGKHKAPEGDYDISSLVERGLDQDDPTMQTYQEWAKKYGVSQKAFEELAGEILEMSGEQNEAIEYDRREEMQKLGNNAQEKIGFLERNIMNAGLNDAERDALSYSFNSADAINAAVKLIQGYTNENIPTQPVVSNPSMTEQDLAQAISDPRWLTDSVWRSKVEQQWMAANS